MRRAALIVLAALLAAGPAARGDPVVDPAAKPGDRPSGTTSDAAPTETVYKIAIPHKKKAEIEKAIGDGTDIKAMRQAIAEAAPAPPAALPGAAPPDARADADTRLKMVQAVEDTRALARRKLDEAEHAPTQADQDKLLTEARDLAGSASAMTDNLVGRTPPSDRRIPNRAGCGMLGDCRLAERLSHLGEAAGGGGFDTRLGEPRGGLALDPNRSGGTDFFQGAPGMRAIEASLDAVGRTAREQRAAGQVAQAAATEAQLAAWRQQARLIGQTRDIARAKRAEAERANPAMASVLRREADAQDALADKMQRRLAAEAPPAPMRQPGGIKFNNQNADGAALALDVTAVEFDPAHGKLTLVGSRSSQGFDLDVFADVLRLAVEKREPFFSLEPRSPEDWDSSSARIAQALTRRFGDSRQVALRIRAVSGPPIHHGDLDYYYAPASRLDPAAAADAGHDDAQNLVFSPDWLRYTKLGWMLYRADLTIKAVASGFRDHDDLSPSAAWSFPDFDPTWLQSARGAGRADFELDSVKVPASATRIDVSDVRPRLYVTRRKAGTLEDAAPSDQDRALTAHFTRHWSEYVRRESELANLEMIYRAYVAARYLVRRHPTLARRILAMPRAADTNLPPLAVTRSPVLRAAFRGDTLVTLDPRRPAYYDISRGFGGGTAFYAFEGTDPHIAIARGDGGRMARVFAWIGADRGGAPWREAGDRRAAVFDLGGAPIPRRWLAEVLGGAAAAVVALGAALVVARALPWQRLGGAEVCAHCLRQSRRVGGFVLAADGAATAALLFVLALPVLAAAHEEPVDAAAFWPIAGVGLGVAGALVLLGFGWRLGTALLLRAAPLRRPIASDILSGARLAVLGLSVLLAAHGLDAPRFDGFVERVVMELGGPSVPAVALFVGSGAALLAFAGGWLAPSAPGARLRARWRIPPTPHLHEGASRQ